MDHQDNLINLYKGMLFKKVLLRNSVAKHVKVHAVCVCFIEKTEDSLSSHPSPVIDLSPIKTGKIK